MSLIRSFKVRSSGGIFPAKSAGYAGLDTVFAGVVLFGIGKF